MNDQTWHLVDNGIKPIAAALKSLERSFYQYFLTDVKGRHPGLAEFRDAIFKREAKLPTGGIAPVRIELVRQRLMQHQAADIGNELDRRVRDVEQRAAKWFSDVGWNLVIDHSVRAQKEAKGYSEDHALEAAASIDQVFIDSANDIIEEIHELLQFIEHATLHFERIANAYVKPPARALTRIESAILEVLRKRGGRHFVVDLAEQVGCERKYAGEAVNSLIEMGLAERDAGINKGVAARPTNDTQTTRE